MGKKDSKNTARVPSAFIPYEKIRYEVGTRVVC